MIKIQKYSGEYVDFDLDKLAFSLSKSGATESDVDEIVRKIEPQIYDGMHTKDLYKLAFKYLKKKSNTFAARFSLKRALRDLGPDGYYFERWVARLFQHMGYETLHNQLLAGYAVNHEIDVLGKKDGALIIAECKFRNTTEAKISVTTPMYFLSRFKDLQGKTFDNFESEAVVKEGWLVTNVFLTEDAKVFCKYYGLDMLSWDFPEDKSIKARVDNTGLYPITCLTTLNKSDKNELLKLDCILVRELIEHPQFMNSLNFTNSKKENILAEAEGLVLN
jgi:Holliday junction resolvase